MYNLSKISWLKNMGGESKTTTAADGFSGRWVPVSSNWWPVSPLSVVGDPLSGEHLVAYLVKNKFNHLWHPWSKTNSTPCGTLGQLGKQIENLLT